MPAPLEESGRQPLIDGIVFDEQHAQRPLDKTAAIDFRRFGLGPFRAGRQLHRDCVMKPRASARFALQQEPPSHHRDQVA